MKNRLTELFKHKTKDILNIYFTAGHPNLNDTQTIIQQLERNNVDLIEIGMPYSDPLADGPTIQASASHALKNGMTTQLLFEQVKQTRETTQIPLILMGNYNQILQFGIEQFLVACSESGIDGLIIPDLPMDVYELKYKDLFYSYNLGMCFLITPETSDDRIIQADKLSSGFLYVVSKSSITGGAEGLSERQIEYFRRLDDLGLKSPRLIGFGIHDKSTYDSACSQANGAIIGSAFIRAIDNRSDLSSAIETFIKKIR